MASLIPPRTVAENLELLRRHYEAGEFEKWCGANGILLSPETDDQEWCDRFNEALGRWQSEKLGEMRSLTLPGMEGAR